MKRSDSQVFCFNAVSERKVQILRFAQVDRISSRCHPERSEGSVRHVSRAHVADSSTFREAQKMELFRVPKYPVSAVCRCFFTRRSGRAETCGCLLPSTAKEAWHLQTDPESFYESVGKSID